MDSKRKREIELTRVHKSNEQTNVHNVKNQDTIFGNSRIKNEMRRKVTGDTIAPRSRKKSTVDSTLDFDPFLEETIYDDKYKRNRVKKKKSNSAGFVITTFIISVAVCILFFTFAFKLFLNPSTTNPNDIVDNRVVVPVNNNQDKSDEILAENVLTITGNIKKYEISDNTISVVDINDRKSYTFIIDGKTKLYDQYGKTIVFAELSVGDIVDITFDSSSVYVMELRKNEHSFIERRVTGVEIDTTSRTIKNGNKTYSYTNDVIVTKDGEDYNINDFDIMDTISFSGYKDEVYKIELIRGHGTLVFNNIEAVENGIVEIDTDILFNLDSQDKVNVSVGDHNLVIKGDNIDVYSNQIFINEDEVMEIDLTNLPNKKGLLTIKSNVPNIQVAIDGIVYTEPIMLPYGTYVVTVSAEDFESETKTVIIEKSQQEVSFQLNAIEKNARIVIDTNPTGAEVYLNNRLIGLTPIDTKIEVGYHEFTIRLEGYDNKLFTRDFDEDTYRYTFEMIPNVQVEDNSLIIP